MLGLIALELGVVIFLLYILLTAVHHFRMEMRENGR